MKGINEVRANIVDWCLRNKVNIEVADKIVEVIDGQACPQCGGYHVNVVLQKLPLVGIILRLECRDCNIQWVPETVEEFAGFGVL